MNRRDFIGGTDAAIICGVSAYKTPYQLWCEKTGLVDTPDISDQPAVKWGVKIEPLLRQEFEETSELRVVNMQNIVEHPDHPWMTGHVDGLIKGHLVGWEGKTAGARNAWQWGEPGTDDVPINYYLQCMHYMACTGYTAWYLSVLIGGQDFRNYLIPRDQTMIDILIQRESDFWDCVVNDTPPPPVTAGDMAMAYPRDNGESIEVDSSVVVLCEFLRETKQQIKNVKAECKSLEDRIKKQIGEHSIICHSGQPLATWKAQKSKRLSNDAVKEKYPDVYEECLEEIEYRVLRLARRKS